MTTIHKIYGAPHKEQNTYNFHFWVNAYFSTAYKGKKEQYFVLLKYAQRKQQIPMLRITSRN